MSAESTQTFSFYYISLLIMLFFLPNSIPTLCALSPQPVIIFDLNGVLLDTDTYGTAKEIGITIASLYALSHWSLPSEIKKSFFNTINAAIPEYKNTFQACDPDGTLLPGAMAQWLLGGITGKNLIHKIDNFTYRSCDISSALFFKKMARTLFVPPKFVRTRRIVPGAVAFLKQCKKDGFRIAILSNWDKESFPLIIRMFPELFSLFDQENIFISSNLNMVKPDPAIFQHVLSQFANTLCIFLDDQQENISAAKEKGSQAILCTTSGGKMNWPSIQKKIKSIAKQNIIPLHLSCEQNDQHDNHAPNAR